MDTVVWKGCYDDSWKGIITPESFAHPAKASRALLRRIMNHMIAEKWLNKGDLLLDPFGGVGTTGIQAASWGIRFVGVELEEKFYKMALENFDLHRIQWEKFSDPLPRMIHGDSRKLAEVLVMADAVVSSPPYNEGLGHGGSPTVNPNTGASKVLIAMEEGYGSSPGQLGAESGETFWSAAREILFQCHAVLRPGAYCAWVTKDFVKNKDRVPFTDDWLRLLVSCGFEPVLRVQAALVKETREASLFGGEIVKTKERKSFFRRLAEKKGSPRIDHEDVLFVRRNG